MKDHSLITTLKSLRGNPRGCVYTEPLWGIPYNLYAPYVTLYMLALNLTETQVGLVASIGVGLQIIPALFGGVITDKLGRRRTTLIFDIIAWSVPALISAIAQNFWYFVAAAAVNSIWRVTQNSWTCLLVEDADQDQLVDIFSWIYIANQIVGFIAPLTWLFIGAFTLVPTVRGLYLFAAVMFTVKAITTYRMTEETAQGKIRMHETKHQRPLDFLIEHLHVLWELLHTRETLYTAGIMLILSIATLINGNFWAVIATHKLQIPDRDVSLFPFIRSAVMIAFFFAIVPRIRTMHFKVPLIVGFLGLIASQVVLITAPVQSYLMLGINVFLEACSFAVVNPLMDRMTVLTVDPQERARIMSIIYLGIIILSSPFGLVAGELSTLSKDLPFILNIGLFAAGGLLAYLAGQASKETPTTVQPTVDEALA